MIDIMGDVIYFNDRPVAIITVPTSTLRDSFVGKVTNVNELDELEAVLDKIKELVDT